MRNDVLFKIEILNIGIICECKEKYQNCGLYCIGRETIQSAESELMPSEDGNIVQISITRLVR